MLAALSHPNIAAIHGIEQAPASGSSRAPVRFLVIELVAGEDLAGLLERGPLRPPDALAVCRQVADALETAHERGIIHRDLKPANVKVMPGGQVKSSTSVWPRHSSRMRVIPIPLSRPR